MVLVLGVVTGCVVPGHSVPQFIDPKTLDVGEFGTEPLAEPAGNETYGRAVESARMGEVMLDPAEVDPTLRYTVTAYSLLPLPTPATARMLLAGPVRDTLAKEGMVAGCAVIATDVNKTGAELPVGAGRVLSTIVLRFPDADSAGRAASAIDSIDAGLNADNVSLTIPGYSGAHAHWRPAVPTMAATVAHDDYVVSLLIGYASTDSAAMVGMAAKAFDVQLNRLRGFGATPIDQLAHLPLDQDGMVRRLLPAAPGRWTYPTTVTSTTSGDAVWNTRAVGMGMVFRERGVSLWILDAAILRGADMLTRNYLHILTRYASPTQARAAFTDAARRDGVRSNVHKIDGPPGLPDVECAAPVQKGSNYSCRVLYGRYIATLLSRDEKTIRQKAAAQYALLVNAG
ncbi:DUF7373 family lipoprotein [Nocardia heshunensis]